MSDHRHGALTDPQLEVVERVLVDLLDAFVEGDGEVGQRTQVTPFIFTLLREAEEEVSVDYCSECRCVLR